MRFQRVPAALVAACVLITGAPIARVRAQVEAKRPIAHDVYDSWKSIQDTVVLREGAWIAYAVVPQDGDGELVVRNLRTGAERRHPRGKDPKFTADGRFVAFAVAPLKEAIDAAKKAGKKDDELPKNGLGVMRVDSGEAFTADRVKSFKLPEESSARVAYLLEPEGTEKKGEEEGKSKDENSKDETSKDENSKDEKRKKKEPGTDLIVRDLASGASAALAGVTEYVWNKDGSRLAYAVSSRDGAYAPQTAGART